MIIDHITESSKYGHICPLEDKCNALLLQKALMVELNHFFKQ